MNLRPPVLAAACACFAGLFTLLVGVLPFLDYAYHSPSLRLLLETAAGLIALLAAYLVFGRFRQSRSQSDLALTSSLTFFAVSNLFLSAVPTAVAGDDASAFATWAPLAGRLLGAAAFAYSAFAPDRRAGLSPRAVHAVAALQVTVLAVIAAGTAALASSLPVGVDPAITATNRPVLDGHPVLHGLHLVAVTLFAVAAIGFTRRAARSRDELLGWLAAAATLATFASLNYFLFPSLFSDWVYAADVLRMAFYLVLLAGAAREIGHYWRAAAVAAVLEERRRMARDLHDGLAQELAFITLQCRRFGGDPRFDVLCAASDRALDESRRAIAALTRPMNEPLTAVLADEAEEVAARVGLALDLQLSDDVEVTPAEREALLRILREAVTNAARHGHATRARVELSRANRLSLRIRDDGVGFDPAAARTSRDGFGLVSMTERAQALGGELRIDSRPDAGTEIEVLLP